MLKGKDMDENANDLLCMICTILLSVLPKNSAAKEINCLKMMGRHIKGYTKYLSLLEIIFILSFDGKVVLQHGENNGID